MTVTLETGQVLAARYALRRALGPSVVAQSWLAHDSVDRRDVVLKFAAEGLDPAAARERLEQELDTGRAVVHPALVAAERLDQDRGRPFLVLPWLAGGEIAQLRGQPWPVVVRRVLPVIDALGALHASGRVHGDVKSTNVLLDGDGLARLADLGSARAIGATGPSDGSPYGMSPQRYSGAPAAVGDDVYALGAMLYELIGGHPPFYPDVSAERVRDETPPPLGGRPSVPETLRDLVAACLAKDAAARPASMTELRRALEHCLERPAGVDDRSASPARRALEPPAGPPPITPQWQRAATSGPSERELRSEGFRRGVLASASVLAIAAMGFVFFVLPGMMEKREPASQAPAPSPAVQPPAAGPAPAPPEDLEKLADLLRRAETLEAPLAERLKALEQHDAAAWSGSGFKDAAVRFESGRTSMGTRDYAAAIANFEAAAAQVADLERRLPGVLRDRIAQGLAALDAGRSSDAKARFAEALRIEPGNAAARAGEKRAEVLDDVLAQTAAGSRLEQQGDAAGAIAAYRRALALDPAARGAREGLARVEAQRRGDEFATAMSRGLAALARQDYAAARTGFQDAGRLRPGAPEVADGLRQVEQAERTRDLSATLESARKAEADEHWAAALAAYRDALKGDPTLLAAQQGVERAEPRAQLDGELQAYIDRPERLYSQEVRAAARGVLARAAQVSPAGPRLATQVERVQSLLKQSETPVRVALTSDNQTQVQIYRVGRLGTFERRDLELMPGHYTVVGTRAGYRDVRKELDLVPGAAPPELVIRCEEPI